MSAEKLITEHLDLWTGAVSKRSTSGRGSNGKVELTGIKKLRELILELAVRGKLVEQNPLDESAQFVLERIEEEIEKEVRTGQRKKPKPVPALSGHETPFAIPSNWQWVRLGRIAETHTGFAFKSREYTTEGTFVLRVTNINQDGTINSSDSKHITPEAAETTYSKFQLKDRDILLVMVGGSLGKIGVVDPSVLPAVLNQNMWKFQLYGPISKDYFVYGLKHINANQIAITNSTHGHLSQSSYLSKLFPLPPAEEQRRIVQKVDELMALCDRLEQQTHDQLEAHEALVDTLLGTLTQSEDATELADNWARLAEHFDTLFTTEQSIDKLKQTILQLAVMGRLVEQNLDDDPAHQLLLKIESEKARLAAKKIIKKTKKLEATGGDMPYQIPSHWCWVRLGQVTNYGVTDKAEQNQVTDNTWVLEMEDIEKESSRLLNKVRYAERQFKSSKNRFERGDVLYGKLRPYLDKVLVADEPGVCTTEIIPIRGYLGLLPEFLRVVLKSPNFKRYANDSTHGMNLPRLGTDKARLAMIPLAPEQEQHRIVQKVDELMTLCDKLKEHVTQANDTRCTLAEAITEQALN